MPTMTIIMNGDACWPDLQKKAQAGQVIHLTNPIQVAALQGGMASGKTSVTLRLNLPDGRVVIAETSLALFALAADGFRARYGE